MYEYRNRKTGAVFSTLCPCAGDAWELISVPDNIKSDVPETKSGKVSKSKKKSADAVPENLPEDGGGKDA